MYVYIQNYMYIYIQKLYAYIQNILTAAASKTAPSAFSERKL